ncbi:MAG: chemotaxis response regulator protein-glutamate methylesterase [Litorimonas sp.]
MRPVSVLIVDDSATLRAVVKAVLRKEPGIDVVGEAADAVEARRLIKALDPDVVTLDIEMPGMNGLQFLEKIMTLRPMPVIMLSASTVAGSDNAITALSTGAFDCVAKPATGNIMQALSDLPDLIRAAAASPIGAMRKTAHGVAAPTPSTTRTRTFRHDALIAIGSSTGGVDALNELLSAFPENCPPTVIAQHMPESFLQSFAERLNRNIRADVGVAKDFERLRSGQIRIAPGGVMDLGLMGRDSYRCRLLPRANVQGHCPSVDVLMHAVAQTAGRKAVGVMLTGMGRDGAEGLLSLRRNGARTFGQDQVTSTVYGMPKAAYDIGAVERQLPLGAMADAILDACSRETVSTQRAALAG